MLTAEQRYMQRAITEEQRRAAAQKAPAGNDRK